MIEKRAFRTPESLITFVLGTILATGLLPAWKNSGTDFNAVLRDGTRGALGKKSGRLKTPEQRPLP